MSEESLIALIARYANSIDRADAAMADEIFLKCAGGYVHPLGEEKQIEDTSGRSAEFVAQLSLMVRRCGVRQRWVRRINISG